MTELHRAEAGNDTNFTSGRQWRKPSSWPLCIHNCRHADIACQHRIVDLRNGLNLQCQPQTRGPHLMLSSHCTGFFAAGPAKEAAVLKSLIANHGGKQKAAIHRSLRL